MATAVDGAYPTGMHYCLFYYFAKEVLSDTYLPGTRKNVRVMVNKETELRFSDRFERLRKTVGTFKYN